MSGAVIGAAQVKALREATGMGMMACKNALVECEGDFERAQDWLRVKSGAKADKVAARQASEGRVAFAAHGGTGVLVEVSCETDFVARDDNMAAFAEAVADAVAREGGGDGEIGALRLADGRTVEEGRKTLVMKLGENIGVRRVRVLVAEAGGGVCAYVHSGDKVAAMCAIAGGGDALGRDVCMHVAAMQPRYVDEKAVPAEVVAREREVFRSQVAEEGKPAEMAEKIAEGKLKKRMGELTLMRQAFVKDGEVTVAQLLERAGATLHGFELVVVGGGD